MTLAWLATGPFLAGVANLILKQMAPGCKILALFTYVARQPDQYRLPHRELKRYLF